MSHMGVGMCGLLHDPKCILATTRLSLAASALWPANTTSMVSSNIAPAIVEKVLTLLVHDSFG